MIFVNDLAGAPRAIVPDWMVHFSERHENGSGMTFVDLVFPAFLFIVGLSIPFSLEKRGSLVIKLGHILVRTLILLAIGILMVNGEEGASNSWYVRMFAFAILAACQIGPKPGTPGKAAWQIANLGLRLLGYAGLLFCALTLKHHDQAMLTLSPFRLHTSWYGILGLIGWAYLAAAMLFVVFRTHSTALLGCVALMTSFYAADRHGFFNHFWPAQFVDFGGTLGSQAAITVAGLLLSTILIRPETASPVARTKFTVLFIAGLPWQPA